MEKKDDTAARSSVQEFVAKSDESFNKNVIYLAAGALGLSMAFIKDIAPPGESHYIFFLVIGWLLLTFTLLLNLISYWLVSKWGYHIGIKLTEFHELKTDTDEEKKIHRETLQTIRTIVDSQNKASRNINLASIFTLILGLSFLLCFIVPNLGHKETKSTPPSCCCSSKK